MNGTHLARGRESVTGARREETDTDVHNASHYVPESGRGGAVSFLTQAKKVGHKHRQDQRAVAER
ncbi:hypothetical protein [Halocatena pleomorpha]|uniref:Uncharacterized protein n=1 Tax=Halocatena pleomorpha TaxID=1785090 RepID=A0A3P3RA61_9EURY|nr:hypothetical protein [Halocatena pleomorpha]RRJ30356.1 hypothetical protein EIK79_10585 [Halocatena pleomorpha]